MPWWIWLILALFMLVMLVAGLVYAALRAFHGVQTLSHVAQRCGDRLAALGEPAPADTADTAPMFTRPLIDVARRYVDAHARVIERRTARRNRHAARWAQWSRFNTD